MKWNAIFAASMLTGLWLGVAQAGDKAPDGPPPQGPGGPPPHGPGGPPGFGPPGFGPRGHGRMPPMLMEADENNDGKITRAEIDHAIKTRFDKADANHDGALNEKEFAAALPKPPEPPEGRKPPEGAPRHPPFDPSAMFKRTDWNGDGKVTFDEFAIQPKAMAMHADMNGDGVISEDDRPGPPPGPPPPE